MINSINSLTKIANTADEKGYADIAESIDNINKELLSITRKNVTWKKVASSDNAQKLDDQYGEEIGEIAAKLICLAATCNPSEARHQLAETAVSMIKEAQQKGFWGAVNGLGRGIKRMMPNDTGNYERMLKSVEDFVTQAPRMNGDQLMQKANQIKQWFMENASRTQNKAIFGLSRSVVSVIDQWTNNPDKQVKGLVEGLQYAMMNMQAPQQQQNAIGNQQQVLQHNFALLNQLVSDFGKVNPQAAQALAQYLAPAMGNLQGQGGQQGQGTQQGQQPQA